MDEQINVLFPTVQMTHHNLTNSKSIVLERLYQCRPSLISYLFHLKKNAVSFYHLVFNPLSKNYRVLCKPVVESVQQLWELNLPLVKLLWFSSPLSVQHFSSALLNLVLSQFARTSFGCFSLNGNALFFLMKIYSSKILILNMDE